MYNYGNNGTDGYICFFFSNMSNGDAYDQIIVKAEKDEAKEPKKSTNGPKTTMSAKGPKTTMSTEASSGKKNTIRVINEMTSTWESTSTTNDLMGDDYLDNNFHPKQLSGKFCRSVQ